jgi:hypothetical protein
MTLFPARGLKPNNFRIAVYSWQGFNESLPRKGTETVVS